MSTHPPVAVRVAAQLAELGVSWDPAGGDQHLFRDLGLDSLAGYELIAMLEDDFDLEFPDGTFDQVFTTSELVAAVVAHTR